MQICLDSTKKRFQSLVEKGFLERDVFGNIANALDFISEDSDHLSWISNFTKIRTALAQGICSLNLAISEKENEILTTKAQIARNSSVQPFKSFDKGFLYNEIESDPEILKLLFQKAELVSLKSFLLDVFNSISEQILVQYSINQRKEVLE